jgi:trk system potassium uptake protein TrkH
MHQTKGLLMSKKSWLSPFALPVYFFALTIVTGTLLLHHPVSLSGADISWLDALFTATSATCVTGLIVVDTGTYFSRFGQNVILGLIQLGGLGVMTYTSLVFYLWRKRVSVTDRIAVGQSLLHDPRFHLGSFLKLMVVMCVVVECSGAGLLYLCDPVGFEPYSALFHSISAFCNAGFSLYGTSMMFWRHDPAVNTVLMVLITLGGLGFYTLLELTGISGGAGDLTSHGARRISWQSRVVLRTSLLLVIFGWGTLFLAEYFGRTGSGQLFGTMLEGLFQSVTCRTAGFNTVDIGAMTNVSLFIMILLMVIGGSPGSCAGGVKTTTFRVLAAFGVSQLKGRKQVVVDGYGLDESTVNKALTLSVFAFLILVGATMILCVTEGGDVPHPLARGRFLEILFETASAFGTVGLSTGLTPDLSAAGKTVITLLMFVGRLGPIVFLSMIQSWQVRERFARPEKSVLIG